MISLLAPFAVATAPVTDESILRGAILRFCEAAASLNSRFIPADPDSLAGQQINSQLPNGISYRLIWTIAKATDMPACRSMW